MLRAVRADLAAQCGGQPTATARRLIECAARLSLVVAFYDAKIADGTALTDGEADAYTRAVAALSSTLRDIAGHGAPLPASAAEVAA